MRRWLPLFLGLLFTIGFTLGALTPPAAWNARQETSQNLHFGLRFEQYRCPALFGGPQVISILELKPDAGYRLAIQACPDGERKTVSQLAKAGNAAAAVNAGFFTFEKPSRPAGALKAAGKVHNDASGGAANRAYLAIPPDGKPVILTPEQFQLEPYDSVVYGNQLLLKEGKITADADPARHPRTLVGITADGTIYLVVVDGRAKESIGVTFRESAELLQALGCVDAINLDGGGSSAMWIRSSGIVNFPSDNKKFDHAGERRVHNILGVYRAANH